MDPDPWMLAGYSLAFGLLLVTGGRLGDLVGRKRVFLAGVGAFTAASALCGLAPGIGVLVAARVVQGAAAGRRPRLSGQGLASLRHWRLATV
jgi:MFS family permease